MTEGRRPVALIVLDGWGHAPPGPGNAVDLAPTPVYDQLVARYPHVLLEASGEAVGLPPGIMGNSEVGHLTMGSGRILYQDLSRINRAVQDGSFFRNAVLRQAMDTAVRRERAVHLMGLLSDGGVHSAIEHLQALVQLAREMRVRRLYLHLFMDGRDTDPRAGEAFLRDVESFLQRERLGRIATIVGRFYAMDRDKRWERVERAYRALVSGVGERSNGALAGIRAAYVAGITDEFVLPTITLDDPDARVADGDTLIFFNYRPDRARELTRAFTQDEFEGFDRGPARPRVTFVSMTKYDETFLLPVAFPSEGPQQVLAQVLSEAGLTQLHIAETEKYAHVTFFFNGGRDEPYPGEQRCLVPSPQDVATYDQKPQMSAYGVAERFREIMAKESIDFVVLNFANPDMVGHTGVLPATVAAVSHVDTCLGQVLDTLRPLGARVFITADHGNAEFMLNEDGSPNTAHTTNPVPLLYLEKGRRLREGAGLSDLAPTILTLLGVPVPEVMSGRSLV